MKGWLSQQGLTRLLGGVTIALAALVGWQLLIPAGANVADGADREPIVPEAVGGTEYDPPQFSAYAEVLERPLFFEDRRLPPEPEVAAPETAPAEPLSLSLEGVVIGSGAKVAVLRDERGNAMIQLTEGMSHNGWVLESVDKNTAEFRRGEDFAKLDMDDVEPVRSRRFRR